MSREGLTILAPATALAPSAVHVVRVSGPRAFDFLAHLTGKRHWVSRQARLATLKDGEQLIDRALVLPFATPASYTGEDVVEFHLHGSPDLTRALLKAGVHFGLSPAQPGEFTRRAFLSGKITLEQAEAVDAVIQSRGDYLRQNALKILEGKASLKFADARDEVLDLLADLETAIEFPEDKPDEVFTSRRELYGRFSAALSRLQHFFGELNRRYHQGRVADEGLRVILLGRPNAGKSTLMNGLLGEDRVLVSPEAGTTRDWVKERCSLGLTTVQLCDTAGLRQEAGHLESQGIERTRALAQGAEVILVLIHEMETLDELASLGLPPSAVLYPVLTKTDLLTGAQRESLKNATRQAGLALQGEVNLTRREEIESLRKNLDHFLSARFRPEYGELSLLGERQALVARDLEGRFARILSLLSGGAGEEVVSEELRQLTGLMGELDLTWGGEDVLDRLFSRFCLGK